MWGEDDLVFSRRDAARLRDAFPNATLSYVARARTFVPEDRPDALIASERSKVTDAAQP